MCTCIQGFSFFPQLHVCNLDPPGAGGKDGVVFETLPHSEQKICLTNKDRHFNVQHFHKLNNFDIIS